MAVLRGNVENNNANISRIEEELKGQEDRSGGIVSQIDQTKARIGEIEAALTEKRRELEELQRKLTAMTASAQGLTKQFLELRGKEPLWRRMSRDVRQTCGVWKKAWRRPRSGWSS